MPMLEQPHLMFRFQADPPVTRIAGQEADSDA
jgi:hypothetical protein